MARQNTLKRTLAVVFITAVTLVSWSSGAIQTESEEEFSHYLQHPRQSSSDIISDTSISDKNPSQDKYYKPKAKLLNLNIEDHSLANSINNTTENKLKKESKLKKIKVKDLSDVSLDGDEEDLDFSPHTVRSEDSRIVNKALTDAFLKDLQNTAVSTEFSNECIENGRSFKIGETVQRSCDETCECSSGGKMICTARCGGPFFKRGRALDDPLCYESAIDDCCAMLVCSSEKEKQKTPPYDIVDRICKHENKSYSPGDRWYVGCELDCQCEESLVVTCLPRCPKLEVKERCINVPDQSDSCCQIQICDVSQDDHEVLSNEDKNSIAQDRSDVDITTEVFLPSTTQKSLIQRVELLHNNSVKIHFTKPNITSIQISKDGGKSYEPKTIDANGLISNLEGDRIYYFRSGNDGRSFDVYIKKDTRKDIRNTNAISKDGCFHSGKFYEIGAEFNVDCEELCECVGTNQTECAKLHCPSQVGLELVSPTCTKWVPDPEDWVPVPPHCCPSKMKCISNGTCTYKGIEIPNWTEVPKALTGCEVSCFCESGTLDCQNFCAPVPEIPPNSLRCYLGTKPEIVTVEDEDCCKEWRCVPKTLAQPDGIASPPHFRDTINYVTIPHNVENHNPPKHKHTDQKFLGPYANPFPTDSPIDYYPKTTVQYRPYPNVVMSNYPIFPQNYDYNEPPKILTTTPSYLGPLVNWTKTISPVDRKKLNASLSKIFEVTKKPFLYKTPTLGVPDTDNKYSEVDDLLTDLVEGEDVHMQHKYKDRDNVFRATENDTSIHFPDDLPLPTRQLPLPPVAPTPINTKLKVLSLKSDTPNSVRLIFELPHPFVGLKGSVDLRYTETDDPNADNWQFQVFAPADGILSTSRLDFRLSGLKPSTEYQIKGILKLEHFFPEQAESDVFKVITLDAEKRRRIDAELRVSDVNATDAHVSWRHFTKDELKYIDGIQVRFRPVGQPIYQTTDILHNSRVYVHLSLKPDKEYEASLVLVPPTGSTVELYDPTLINFMTPQFIDIYNWTVTLKTESIASNSMRVAWIGVPSPAEMFVRIYKVAHTCGPRREQKDLFLQATRNQQAVMMLNDLEPGTRCRVWMEIVLTNGKLKMSNVLDVTTNPRESAEPVDSEMPKTDYYSALVVTGVIAALGALASLVLLFFVIKRHRPHSVSFTTVPATAPHDTRSLPPYDSSTYKMELHQETMNL